MYKMLKEQFVYLKECYTLYLSESSMKFFAVLPLASLLNHGFFYDRILELVSTQSIY